MVWIVESSLRGWLLTFVVVVFLFGGLYAWLSSHGHGINGGSTEIDYWDGLYFSVVTVSSLGYGDLHPQGYAKIAAGLEVFMGLAFVGVMIAKLTSKPLSYLVSRLFVSEVKRELGNIGSSFDVRLSELTNLIEANDVYHPTPGTSRDDELPRDPRELAGEWGNCLQLLADDITKLHDYIKEEHLSRGYFIAVPADRMVEVARKVSTAIEALGQAAISLPGDSATTNRILTFANRTSISSLISKTTDMSETIGSALGLGEEVKSAYAVIDRACSVLKDALRVEHLYPDQVISGSNGE